MKSPQIDFNQIADGVTAILNERAHAAHAAQREAEREATIRAQHEAERAIELEKAQRRADKELLQKLEVQITTDHDTLEELVRQYRALPDRIALAERSLSVCLQQAQQLRLRMGLRS